MDKQYTVPKNLKENPVGEKYNFVEVVHILGVYKQKLWVEGRCDCGRTKEFKLNSLRTGNTKSCGKCKLTRPIDPKRFTEGCKHTPTYESWRAMKERCNNVRASYYHNYGGRGISYDPSWENFDCFYADMGERPQGSTLDRIDVDGNYCKENCKWSDYTEQRYNTRKRSDNSSGRTGVHYNRKLGKWVVRIQKNGESRYLGAFSDFNSAVEARKQAEIDVYGETKKYEII